jgi:hypothetical protein
MCADNDGVVSNYSTVDGDSQLVQVLVLFVIYWMDY